MLVALGDPAHIGHVKLYVRILLAEREGLDPMADPARSYGHKTAGGFSDDEYSKATQLF
jgi:hypothetical protein